MIIHFDLDAFFASVEQAYNPKLKGKAVAVAGTGRRSVVSAASYEARKWGVRSALATAVAKKLCPGLVIVEPRFGAYKILSTQIMMLAKSMSEKIEPVSLDEAYLELGDVTEECAVQVAKELRKQVRERYDLAVSVGIADTKVIAKLASDDAKPDGLRLVKKENALTYLGKTPVEKVWGIGPATLEKIRPLGVKRMEDLQGIPLEVLTSLLGEHQGKILKNLSMNKDERKVEPRAAAKSVSHENTFEKDISEPVEILRNIKEVTFGAWARLGGEGARTVSVKTRSWDFKETGRSCTFTQATSDLEQILTAVEKLIKSIDTSEGVRLLGVSLGNLAPQRQGALFSSEPIEIPQSVHPLGSWAFKGAPVEHPLYGEGHIRYLQAGGIEVSFKEGVRLFDPNTETIKPTAVFAEQP